MVNVILTLDINYHVPSFMKENSCSYKLRCERYLKRTCMCFLDNMHVELTCMRIPYNGITCVYKKTHMMVV